MDLVNTLAGGDRRSTGNSELVAEEILRDPKQLPTLVTATAIDDAIVRSRASHALMLLSHKEAALLQPYKEELFALMGPQTQWEVREQFCKIIVRLDLDSKDLTRALGIFQTYLEAKHSIVRTCALQGLHDLTHFDATLKPQVVHLLQHFATAGSAAMRARCRNLLKGM